MSIPENAPDGFDHLIDFATGDVMYSSDRAGHAFTPGRTELSTKNVPTKTPLSRFTPLPSPVISDRFLLGTVLSSPSSAYVTRRFQGRGHGNLEQTEEEAGAAKVSGIATPQQLPFDPVACGTPPPSANQQPSSTRQSRLSHGHPSRPSSQVALDELHSSNGASAHKCRSRHSSANRSTTRVPPADSVAELLTETALKLHSDQSRTANACGLAQSGAASPSAHPFRPATDAGSRASHWTRGEPKDVELETLNALSAHREAHRAQELSQIRREAEMHLTEQERDFDALSDIVHERKQMREKDLGDLAGEMIGSQVAPGSPQSSILFCSPRSAREAIHGPRDTHPPSPKRSIYTTMEAPFMMEDVAETLRQASISANAQAEALMDNIKATSRAASITQSAKAHSLSEMKAGSNRNSDQAAWEETKPNSEKGASKAPTVSGLVETSSRTIKSKAPSVQMATSSRRPSSPSLRELSHVTSNHSRSVSVHDRHPLVADNSRSQSVARNVDAPSVVASSHGGTGNRVPTNAGSMKSRDKGGSKAPTPAVSIRATSNAKGSRAVSTTSRDPPISIARNSQAPMEAETPQLPANAESNPPQQVSGSARAASILRSMRSLSNNGGGGGSISALSNCGNARAPSNAGGYPPSINGGGAGTSSHARTPRTPALTGSNAAPSPGRNQPPTVAEGSTGSSRPPTVVEIHCPLTGDAGARTPPQSQGEKQPDADDANTEVMNERQPSIIPPKSCRESTKAASLSPADGILPSQTSDRNDGITETNQDNGLTTENPVFLADGNQEALAEDPAVENSIAPREASLMGSKEGEIIAHMEVMSEPLAGDKIAENNHLQQVPGLSIPLGRWIRFGRAGFRFHICQNGNNQNTSKIGANIEMYHPPN